MPSCGPFLSRSVRSAWCVPEAMLPPTFPLACCYDLKSLTVMLPEAVSTPQLCLVCECKPCVSPLIAWGYLAWCAYAPQLSLWPVPVLPGACENCLRLHQLFAWSFPALYQLSKSWWNVYAWELNMIYILTAPMPNSIFNFLNHDGMSLRLYNQYFKMFDETLSDVVIW